MASKRANPALPPQDDIYLMIQIDDEVPNGYIELAGKFDESFGVHCVTREGGDVSGVFVRLMELTDKRFHYEGGRDSPGSFRHRIFVRCNTGKNVQRIAGNLDFQMVTSVYSLSTTHPDEAAEAEPEPEPEPEYEDVLYGEPFGDVLVLEFGSKELTMDNVGLYKESIAQALNAFKNIVLNMRRLSYVDSMGFAFLLTTLRQISSKGGKLRICEVQREIFPSLQTTSLDKVVEVFATREEALRNFR